MIRNFGSSSARVSWGSAISVASDVTGALQGQRRAYVAEV
jgi:hypothetical protein